MGDSAFRPGADRPPVLGQHPGAVQRALPPALAAGTALGSAFRSASRADLQRQRHSGGGQAAFRFLPVAGSAEDGPRPTGTQADHGGGTRGGAGDVRGLTDRQEARAGRGREPNQLESAARVNRIAGIAPGNRPKRSISPAATPSPSPLQTGCRGQSSAEPTPSKAATPTPSGKRRYPAKGPMGRSVSASRDSIQVASPTATKSPNPAPVQARGRTPNFMLPSMAYPGGERE